MLPDGNHAAGGLMKLSSRQDINAPAAFVFTALADFEAWERAAMRRGADVERTDKANRDGSGRSWLIRFTYRGKARRIAVQLTAMRHFRQTPSKFAAASLSTAQQYVAPYHGK